MRRIHLARGLAVLMLMAAAAADGASEAKKVLLIAGRKESFTAQGLAALGIAYDRRSAGEYRSLSPFDYDVIVWGMDEKRSVLASAAEQTRAFLEVGGVMLCFRSNESEAWMSAAMKRGKSYEFGQVLKPDHPIFNTPHKLSRSDLLDVHSGSIYRAFCRLDARWQPLVSTGRPQQWDKSEEPFPGEPHYGLVELPVGKGRLIMTQMIPAYHWFNDRGGDSSSNGARFFENLMRYALAQALGGAASRPPRQVPPGFSKTLEPLLALPRGFGDVRPPAGQWEVRKQGPYSAKSDRRGVWTVTHADAASRAGNFCELTREFPLPAASRRFSLRWYVSDTYCGGRERILGGAQHGKTAFINRREGFRFTQVLVNGKRVWEQDVLGRNPQPALRRFHTADISDNVKPGGRICTVTLRVEDRQSTGERPFAIDVFWGAVAVLPDFTRAPATTLLAGAVRADGTVTLTPSSILAVYRHRGQAGRFRLAFRLRDSVPSRPRLVLSRGGRTVATWPLTADDHAWYWAVTDVLDLKQKEELSLALRGEGECPIREVAVLPIRVLKPQQTAAPRRRRKAKKPLVPSFALSVPETAGVSRRGEIATQGVPFAEGSLRDVDALRARSAKGKRVPMQARQLVTWPDGSVKIAVVSLPVDVPGGRTALFSINAGGGPAPAPRSALSVAESADAITIDTGAITAVISKLHGRIVDTVRRSDGRVLKRAARVWDLALEDETGRVVRSGGPTVRAVEIIERGPLRALIVRKGSFADSAGRLVDYRLQLEAWSGSDALGLDAIIINREDTPQVYLKRWSMKLAGADPKTARVWLDANASAPANEGAVLYQHKENRLTWTGAEGARKWAEGRAPGVFRIAGVAVGARWFWQRYPQAIRFGRDAVRFDFIPQAMDERDLPIRWAKRMAAMTRRYTVGGVGYPQSPGKIGLFRLARGEALHQELRFVFDGGAADSPVREAMAPLQARLRGAPGPGYTAATRAFGQFQPAGKLFPRYENALVDLYTHYLRKREQRREYGFENFGDDTFEWGYGPSYTYWSNSEYDHHHGFAIQYLRSADPRWWELCEQQARMYRDVVVIHAGSPRQFGGPHHHNATSVWMPSHEEQRWVADHTAAGASTGHSWAQGMIDYWFLTGDPWAAEAVRELAAWYCERVETNSYGAGGQERGPGWSLIAVSALYRALQTDRLRAAGDRIAEWIINWQDPMRGVLSVPISEQPSYEGGTTFMHGIVGRALGRWYDATGDPRVRLACLGIAEWMTTEPMGPLARFWYKQSPRNSRRYGATSQTFTGLTYAYTLSRDPWFGKVALALYRQTGPGIRSISWYPQGLAQLASAITPAEVTSSSERLTVAPDAPGALKIAVRNTTDQPLAATAECTPPPPFTATPSDRVIVPAAQTAELSVEVRTKDKTGLADVRVRVVLMRDKELLRTDELTYRLVAVPRIVRLPVPASAAVLTAPMVLDRKQQPPAAHTPRGPGFAARPRPTDGVSGGAATFAFDVPTAGRYHLQAEVYWLDGEGNSFYIQVDDAAEKLLGNSGEYKKWIWIDAGTIDFTAGKHRVRIRTREDGALLRAIRVNNTPR